mgnify:CR=1 FL=1
MAENKYHFERLTPTDSIDLNVYEGVEIPPLSFGQRTELNDSKSDLISEKTT